MVVRLHGRDIEELMLNTECLRIISFTGGTQSGCTTLSHALSADSGVIKVRKTGGRFEADQNWWRIGDLCSTLYYEQMEHKYLISGINISCSPAWSVSSTNLVDGALIVVDVTDELYLLHTEHLLRQALEQRTKPIVLLNKLDVLIKSPSYCAESIYQRLDMIVQQLNSISKRFNTTILPEHVCFCSGFDLWAFTLGSISAKLMFRLNTNDSDLIQKLWGDNYYNEATKQWCQDNSIPRAFCKYALEPIYNLYELLKTNQVDILQETLQVTFDRHELEKDKFTQAVMSKYMPISVILGEVVLQVDSPLTAQQRYTKDFIGVQESSIERVIRECDKNGETVAYISSAIALHGVRISIGRVLSGAMHHMCNMYTPSKQGPISSNRRKIAYIVSPYVAEASKIYCGNLVAFIDFQGENTVLSTCDGIKPFGLLDHKEHVVKLKFDCATSVASILRTIERNTNVKADQDDDGLVCITGMTVEHVKHAVKVAAIDCPFTLHAVYRETVVKPGEVAMGLSPNRANRFYVSAAPVDTNCSCLEDWKTHYSRMKVFSFENTSKCNILIDNTTGALKLDFKLDSLCASFTRVCEVGVLCGQEMFGVQFTVHNITTHSDLIHVGHGQVFLGSRKAFNKAQILADTRLMEPIFEIVIECMEDVLGAILDIIMNSNGSVCSVCTCSGIVYSICCIIPVQESFTLEVQIVTLCNRKALISSTRFCRWNSRSRRYHLASVQIYL